MYTTIKCISQILFVCFLNILEVKCPCILSWTFNFFMLSIFKIALRDRFWKIDASPQNRIIMRKLLKQDVPKLYINCKVILTSLLVLLRIHHYHKKESMDTTLINLVKPILTLRKRYQRHWYNIKIGTALQHWHTADIKIENKYKLIS